MNDTQTIESAMQILEFASNEVKLGAAGVAGAVLIAHYLKNYGRGVTMLARGESAFNSIYGFFNYKKKANMVEANVTIEEFNQLVDDQRSERVELLAAISDRLANQYDPNALNFLQDLHLQIADYPLLPDNAVLSVDEIKQVIKARCEHHAKIISTMSNYLESAPLDELTQANIIKEELK